jgi:putative endonuclease
MGKRHLSWSWRIASADNPGRADRVMGRSKWAATSDAFVKPPTSTGNPRNFKCLLGSRRRQDRRQTAGGERLASSWRSNHQQAVTTRGRDLEGIAKVGLAAQIGQIGSIRLRRGLQWQRLWTLRLPLPRCQIKHLREAVQRQDLDSVDERGLRPVFRRHDHGLGALLARRLGYREHSGDRAQRSVQGKLTRHCEARQTLPLELPGRHEQGDRDRQVQPRAGLAQARWGKVGDDASQGEVEAAVGERRAHPLTRLPDRGVGQADHREGRQATVDVDLDSHGSGGDAVEGEGPRRSEHCATLVGPGARVVRRSKFLWTNYVTKGMLIPAALASGAMTEQRQRLGRRAEDLVADRLHAAGLEILERNARTRHGELDIVALDGRTLVFVEVKAGRAGSAFGPERPILSIDFRKQRRIRRLATAWMGEHRGLPRYDEIRFDAVGVTFDRESRVLDYEHILGAF